MLSRIFALLAVVAFTLVLSQVSLAADQDKAHEGKVVKAGANKLTMTDKDGKNEHTHDVPATATITCDGKACKLEDLKAGTMVKVTMKDEKVASIEGKTKDK
jgi:hypothetical protein